MAWAEAARHVGRFPEGVVSARDANGFPLSVRQTRLAFDAATGTVPVTIPDALDAAPGPACLLCHAHDDKLWSLRAIQVKGRLERDGAGWRFVTTAFAPPSAWRMLRDARATAKSYLAKRGLATPEVNFAAIARMWERAKTIRDP
jgi:hypothetical protein